MTPIEKAILESLQYLLWTHQPRSSMSEEKRDTLMVANHLLLNPIGIKEEPCCEMPKYIDFPFVRKEYKDFVKSKDGEEVK